MDKPCRQSRRRGCSDTLANYPTLTSSGPNPLISQICTRRDGLIGLQDVLIRRSIPMAYLFHLNCRCMGEQIPCLEKTQVTGRLIPSEMRPSEEHGTFFTINKRRRRKNGKARPTKG